MSAQRNIQNLSFYGCAYYDLLSKFSWKTLKFTLFKHKVMITNFTSYHHFDVGFLHSPQYVQSCDWFLMVYERIYVCLTKVQSFNSNVYKKSSYYLFWIKL